MKHLILICFLFCISCAKGSTGPLRSSSEGGGGSSTVSSTVSSSGEGGQTSSSMVGSSASGTIVDPYQKTDDEALVYSLDQTFWQVWFASITSADQQVDASWPCFNDGTVHMIGTVSDDVILNHVNMDLVLTFDNCLIPDNWIQANMIYSGEMRAYGYLDNGPYDDMFTLSSQEMRIQGWVHYTDQHTSVIDERCSFSFLDDFREDQGIGGLGGKMCGRKTYIAERDLWGDD